MLIKPSLIKVKPISKTTMPVTSGVISFLTQGRILETPISMNEPAITTPKIAAITCSTDVPAATMALPIPMIGPIKLKLVPCTISNPAPNGPTFLHCKKVAIPEIINDMDRIMLVSSRDTPSARQINKPGVTIGTRIAKRCCNAAKNATKGFG